MGLKETNAELREQIKQANRRIEALEDWKHGLPKWAKATSNYPTIEALNRYESYRASRREASNEAARKRTLEAEGQGDIA